VTDIGGSDCQRTCWIVGAATGVGAAVLLVTLAKLPLGLSALAALVLGAGLALFLRWAFCAGLQVEQADGPDISPVAPPVPDAPPVPKSAPAARSVDPLPVSAASAANRAPLRTARKPRSAAAPGRAAVRPVRAAGLDVAVSKSKTAVQPGSAVTLDAPRNGVPDPLQDIAGIGPMLERLLNDAGVWHFDQIASWKARDIAYFNGKIPGFRGRITRDGWVAQARALAAAKSGDEAGQG
jgi:predicted flap endonuclease-1-like 5' DNA nuclease